MARQDRFCAENLCPRWRRTKRERAQGSTTAKAPNPENTQLPLPVRAFCKNTERPERDVVAGQLHKSNSWAAPAIRWSRLLRQKALLKWSLLIVGKQLGRRNAVRRSLGGIIKRNLVLRAPRENSDRQPEKHGMYAVRNNPSWRRCTQEYSISRYIFPVCEVGESRCTEARPILR